MADFLAFYGLRTFDKLTYDLYVGLAMNLGRVRMFPAWATMQGIKAFLARELPEQLFDSVAPTEDAAADMAFDANVEITRREAERAALRMLGR